MTLRNLPHDREEDLRTHVIPREVEYARFDPIEHQAQIGFFDLRQALLVRKSSVIPTSFLTGTPRRTSTRGTWSVQFGYPMSLVLTWIILFGAVSVNSKGAESTTLFYSLYPNKNVIKIVSAASVSAREFIEKYMSAAEGIDAQLLLTPQRRPLSLSKITTTDLGASVTLGIRLHRNQRCSLPEHHEAFNYSGHLKISEEFREDLSHGSVFLTFNGVNNAMRCIVGFERDEKHTEFEDAGMNFIDARHLASFVKTYKRRGL